MNPRIPQSNQHALLLPGTYRETERQRRIALLQRPELTEKLAGISPKQVMDQTRDEIFKTIYALPDEQGKIFEDVTIDNEDNCSHNDIEIAISEAFLENVEDVFKKAFFVEGYEDVNLILPKNWEEKLSNVLMSIRYNGAAIDKAIGCIDAILSQDPIHLEKFIRYCRDSKRIEYDLVDKLNALVDLRTKPRSNHEFPKHVEQLDDMSFYTDCFALRILPYGNLPVVILKMVGIDDMSDEMIDEMKKVLDIKKYFSGAFVQCVFQQQLDEVLTDFYGEKGGDFFKYLEACEIHEPGVPFVKELLRRRDEYRKRQK